MLSFYLYDDHQFIDGTDVRGTRDQQGRDDSAA